MFISSYFMLVGGLGCFFVAPAPRKLDAKKFVYQ